MSAEDQTEVVHGSVFASSLSQRWLRIHSVVLTETATLGLMCNENSRSQGVITLLNLVI